MLIPILMLGIISNTGILELKTPNEINLSFDCANVLADEYSYEDFYNLSHVIMGEAEGNSWQLKIDVASVVLNRVEDKRFPNSIEEVIFEPNQYACTWDGRFYLDPNEDCYNAARFILYNGSQLPEDIIYQANFPQGNYVYSSYENTYFCG